MGRKKLYDKTPIPYNVWIKVVTLCQMCDYNADKGIIKQINEAISIASLRYEDIVATIFIADIVMKRGYYKSPAQNYMTHNSYAIQKRQFVRDIATHLGLL